MTTQIQTLVAEARQLRDAAKRADLELAQHCDKPVLDPTTRALQDVYDEASDRLAQIEDFLMTRQPTCTNDALVLLSIATAMAKLPVEERYTAAQHKRMLPRILAEVLKFLEREAGTTADTLLGDAFGAAGATWQDYLSQMVATLPASRPVEPAHTA